jgi:hypothetical protein
MVQAVANIANMADFFDNTELADVIIRIVPEGQARKRGRDEETIAAGTTLHGHRFAMSSNSEYFRTLFKDRWNEDKRQEVTITVLDDSYMQAGSLFVRAMYGPLEMASLDDRVLVKVARLANQYQVKPPGKDQPLHTEITSYLSSSTKDPLAWLELTSLLLDIDKDAVDIDKAGRFIKRLTKDSSGFKEAVPHAIAFFATLTPLYDNRYQVIHKFHVDLLVAALKSDDLLVSSENSVASIVADYCRINKPTVDDCIRLASCIRAKYLSPTYLTGIFPFLFDCYEKDPPLAYKKMKELLEHVQALAVMQLVPPGIDIVVPLHINIECHRKTVKNMITKKCRPSCTGSAAVSSVDIAILWKDCLASKSQLCVLDDGVYWCDGVQFKLGVWIEETEGTMTVKTITWMMHASRNPNRCVRKGIVCCRTEFSMNGVKYTSTYAYPILGWYNCNNCKKSVSVAEAQELAAAGEKIELSFQISVL